ncbi:MAG: protein-methionine-sulfoxide reductase heme-binding subunit MsrQ [Rhodospirillaceae bacterium]
MTPNQRIRWVAKPAIWLLALAPLAWLVWLALNQQLGPNPAESMNRFLGDWAFRLLLVALAVTPLRLLTGNATVVRFRRLLGLFAFFYVALHLASYVAVDQFFDWKAIWNDIVKRTYITLGMAGFVILLALAATSTKGMIKRLGGKGWNRLHKGVYLAGALAAVHFIMMRKGFQLEPLVYAGILALLLAARLLPARRRASHQASST